MESTTTNTVVHISLSTKQGNHYATRNVYCKKFSFDLAEYSFVYHNPKIPEVIFCFPKQFADYNSTLELRIDFGSKWKVRLNVCLPYKKTFLSKYQDIVLKEGVGHLRIRHKRKRKCLSIVYFDLNLSSLDWFQSKFNGNGIVAK